MKRKILFLVVASALIFFSPGPVLLAQGTAGLVAADRTNTTAYTSSILAKGVPGVLFSLAGYNSGGVQFIQLFDSATLPADGAAPIWVITVTATSNFSFDVPVSG